LLKLCLQLLVLLLLLLRGLRLFVRLRTLLRQGMGRDERMASASRGRIDAAGRNLAGDFRRDLRRRGLLVSLPPERVE
jgi:hypothetical protein